jgi:hypothetical protein
MYADFIARLPVGPTRQADHEVAGKTPKKSAYISLIRGKT